MKSRVTTKKVAVNDGRTAQQAQRNTNIGETEILLPGV